MKHFSHTLKTLGLALAVFLGTSPLGLSWAAEPAKNIQELHLRYEAYWSGFHIADFTLSMLNGGGTYKNNFILESRGLVGFFTDLDATAQSHGQIVHSQASPSAEYKPQHYHTKYTSKKHLRWVDISFENDTAPAIAKTGTSPIPGWEERWNPKDKGPEILEKVEPKHRVDVNDPLTLIPQLMATIRSHFEGGPKEAVLKGFDGRRRFDAKITYLGPATRNVRDTIYETYRVRIKPIPVAGFKKRHQKIWNKAAYDFYLSRDGNFIPVQIAPVGSGPTMNLLRICDEPCSLEDEGES
ncbi:MAG: DUF3108 domain-containing protein [Magnetovibrio sp.]|nr:DUF3108 domain-containing protein [Magnetovibrio sp.]